MKWPGSQYDETLSAENAYTVLGLDRHVRAASLNVYVASGGTFYALVSNNKQADIEADNAEWYDLFGEGTVPQSVNRSIDLELADWQAVKVLKTSSAGTVKFAVTVRRA
jgi:hypothetical protein